MNFEPCEVSELTDFWGNRSREIVVMEIKVGDPVKLADFRGNGSKEVIMLDAEAGYTAAVANGDVLPFIERLIGLPVGSAQPVFAIGLVEYSDEGGTVGCGGAVGRTGMGIAGVGCGEQHSSEQHYCEKRCEFAESQKRTGWLRRPAAALSRGFGVPGGCLSRHDTGCTSTIKNRSLLPQQVAVPSDLIPHE